MNLNRIPPLDEPTSAEPGTIEKLEVMIRRYASGKQIFHPHDNRNFSVVREQNYVRLIVGGKRETRNPGSRRSRAKFLRGYIYA